MFPRLFRFALCICLGLTYLQASSFADTLGSPRKLAPWVLNVIPPDRDETDTFSGPRELVEIVQGTDGLEWTPNSLPKSETLLELSKNVIFRRNIWCLEFSFKPVRMLYVDVPQSDGTTEKKLIWYMIYRVRNTGFHQQPTAQVDRWGHKLYSSGPVDHTTRFFPRFILESLSVRKAYVDRVIPTAVEQITSIEDPNTRFLNSVEISQSDIQVSTEKEDNSLWGIATWEGVDPRTDFFSVSVYGLTNAYRWETVSEGFTKNQPPRSANRYRRKALQLNFWRPGDSVRQQEDEVRFGMPALEDVEGRNIQNAEQLFNLYRVSAPLSHVWVFR